MVLRFTSYEVQFGLINPLSNADGKYMNTHLPSFCSLDSSVSCIIGSTVCNDDSYFSCVFSGAIFLRETFLSHEAYGVTRERVDATMLTYTAHGLLHGLLGVVSVEMEMQSRVVIVGDQPDSHVGLTHNKLVDDGVDKGQLCEEVWTPDAVRRVQDEHNI